MMQYGKLKRIKRAYGSKGNIVNAFDLRKQLIQYTLQKTRKILVFCKSIALGIHLTVAMLEYQVQMNLSNIGVYNSK
jgi:hypothetical protein